MIISFGGNAGSGKSTIAKMLAEKLGWQRYYVGGIRRQKAKERGLTLSEYNILGESDPSTDLEVDEYQRELGKTLDNFVIEGRTSFFLIPHSFKIFLDVDENVAAKRLYEECKKKNERNEGDLLKSVEEALALLRQRKQSDDLRYRKYYNVEAFNPANFDYVLDTTNLTPDQVFDQVYRAVKEKLANIDKS
ncbi:MAG: cytidylate kinase [Parcubacteria group bacterium GW2011_GWE2_39_37]|nr:MAG: cytidylate kinase [Parcubacteria group bacterium GW2011_GWE2_39_37]